MVFRDPPGRTGRFEVPWQGFHPDLNRQQTSGWCLVGLEHLAGHAQKAGARFGTCAEAGRLVGEEMHIQRVVKQCAGHLV